MNLFRLIYALNSESISEWKGESDVSSKIVDVDPRVKMSSKEADHSCQSFTILAVSNIEGIQGSIPSDSVFNL